MMMDSTKKIAENRSAYTRVKRLDSLLFPCLVANDISDPPYCFDDAVFLRIVNSVSHIAHVDIHDVAVARIFIAPNVTEYLVSCEHDVAIP